MKKTSDLPQAPRCHIHEKAAAFETPCMLLLSPCVPILAGLNDVFSRMRMALANFWTVCSTIVTFLEQTSAKPISAAASFRIAA